MSFSLIFFLRLLFILGQISFKSSWSKLHFSPKVPNIAMWSFLCPGHFFLSFSFCRSVLYFSKLQTGPQVQKNSPRPNYSKSRWRFHIGPIITLVTYIKATSPVTEKSSIITWQIIINTLHHSLSNFKDQNCNRFQKPSRTP
jgi:hypothetical protein